jgi:DNA repair protein RadA/Sms
MKEIKILRGQDLHFNDGILKPMKTNSEMDVILSDGGGLMPATNMVIAGGAGSGKTTLTLDMLARLTSNGYKTLFISGEMDEIGYFKYCKRLPSIAKVPVFFVKNHVDTLAKTLMDVLDTGYDVVAIDSVAEILGMFRDVYKTTEVAGERWLLELQDKHKMGRNSTNTHTTFINIQQVTKGGQFSGSNRLKHMTDGLAMIKRDADTSERRIQFDKNRDGNTDQIVTFNIRPDHISYGFESE